MKLNKWLSKFFMLLSLMGFSVVVSAQDVMPEEKTEEVSKDLKPTGNYVEVMSGACEKTCALQKYDPTALVAQADAKVGDITRCIVSGVAIKVNENTHMVSYKGQEFYTCCATCAGFFEKDPERFLQ